MRRPPVGAVAVARSREVVEPSSLIGEVATEGVDGQGAGTPTIGWALACPLGVISIE
jgi:hypothetical protein